MATNANFYRGVALNGGPSPIIWADCPVAELIENPDRGIYYCNHFIEDLSGWTETQATSGTIAVDTDEAYGAIILDAGATIADQGIQAQSSNCCTIAAGNKVYFEARVKSANSAGLQMFLGLADDDTTVMASGANSTANHIGFECSAATQAATASSVDFVNEDAGTRSTDTAPHTFVDGTYVNLGFVVDGTDSITPYVDGVAQTAITSNIPTAAMALTLLCQEEGGSVQPTLTIDWIRYAYVID